MRREQILDKRLLKTCLQKNGLSLILAPSYTLVLAQPRESHTARQSVYTRKSYKSIWIPQQSSSNLFVWNLWWIGNFQQTQRRPYPHLFVHVKGWVISQHDWVNTIGGVCVFLFISLNEWVEVDCKAICPSQTPNLSLSLCMQPEHTHIDILASVTLPFSDADIASPPSYCAFCTGRTQKWLNLTNYSQFFTWT